MAIRKMRREWFGGVVYSENPGFTAFVDGRAADELGMAPAGGLEEGLFSAPLDVHLSLTTRCTLRCRGCYAIGRDEPGRDMPVDLARAILDRLAAMNVFAVAIGGGEPLLHPHLFDVAAWCRQREMVPNLTTNGLAVDAAVAAACRVFGSVHVSCHEPAEIGRLEEPIRRLKAAGVDVGLNVLVSAPTYDGLPRIWAWCARQGLSRILVLKFKVSGCNRACADMALDPSQEQALIPLVRRLARRYGIMPMLDCSLFPALARSRPKRRDLEFFDVRGCVGGRAILAVTADGRFKPCSFCETPCGDALGLTRETWMRNEGLAAFRRVRGEGLCEGCGYGDLCMGGCRVAPTPWCVAETARDGVARKGLR